MRHSDVSGWFFSLATPPLTGCDPDHGGNFLTAPEDRRKSTADFNGPRLVALCPPFDFAAFGADGGARSTC